MLHESDTIGMEEFNKSLSLGDCKQLMQSNLNISNVEIISYEIQRYSDKVEGLLGQHFKLEIKYISEDFSKTEQFFMKVLNGGLSAIFEMCMSINAYEKEKFFYNTFTNELKKFHININFVPRCYFCKPYLIVLEDLSLKDYKGAGSVDLDVDTCKAALKTIAKLHSSSILYESAKADELGRPFNLYATYPKVLENVFFCEENNLAKEWLGRSIDGVHELIKIFPENHIKNNEFSTKLTEFLNRLNDVYENFKNSTQTILHGDLWHNNFLFRYRDEKVYDSMLLDFQLLKYGPPSTDVLHFLFANTRRTFRDSNLNKLIDVYYEYVKDNLVEHEYCEIPSKSEYLLLSKDVRVLTKILCLCDRTVTLMPEDTTSDTFDNDENLRRYLFEERSSALITSFKADKHFREIIEEDIFELRELLFEDC